MKFNYLSLGKKKFKEYKQEAHGPHRSSEKQFQSIYIFSKSYDYIDLERKKTAEHFLIFEK